MIKNFVLLFFILFIFASCDLFIKLNKTEWEKEDEEVKIGSGRLSYKGNFMSSTDLDTPSYVVVSPDGRNVYVATGTTTNNVVWFDRDIKSGNLTYRGVDTDAVTGTLRTLDISPDGKNIYAATNTTNEVLCFDRDLNTGSINFKYSYSLTGAFHVIVSPDGLNVYVGCYSSSEIQVYKRESDGSLTGIQSMNVFQFVSVEMSNDCRYVYASSNMDDEVAVFKRNINDGSLTLIDNFTVLNARSPRVSPDDRFLYIIDAELSPPGGSIILYNRDLNNGLINQLKTFQESEINQGLYSVIAPDGNHIYFTYGTATDCAVCWFKINKKNGSLSDFDLYSNGAYITFAQGIAISPDGRHVYVTGRDSDSIVWFDRDK